MALASVWFGDDEIALSRKRSKGAALAELTGAAYAGPDVDTISLLIPGNLELEGSVVSALALGDALCLVGQDRMTISMKVALRVGDATVSVFRHDPHKPTPGAVAAPQRPYGTVELTINTNKLTGRWHQAYVLGEMLRNVARGL